MSDAHRECWDNLPWLANERLSPREAHRIGRHLQQCAECQQELAVQQRLRDAVRSGDEPLVLAPQAGLQRLMSRIEAEESRAAAETAAKAERATAVPPALGPARPRPWLAIAAAMQTITIGALLAGLWWQVREVRSREVRNSAPYITLTAPKPAVPVGPVLRVVFADAVSLSELNELLREVGAQIIDGPSEHAGVYTLVLRGNGQRQDPDAVLAKLGADARVIFAEEATAQVERR